MDFYYFGWRNGPAIWTITALALFLLAVGNRVGVVLTAALAAFAMSALESETAWDYVVDPLIWLVSLGTFGLRAAAAIRRRWMEGGAQKAGVEATGERPAEPVASVPRSAPADL